jgi:hypothetical protein
MTDDGDLESTYFFLFFSITYCHIATYANITAPPSDMTKKGFSWDERHTSKAVIKKQSREYYEYC